MLIPTRGLEPSDLSAIAELEARVVAHDGGRLKLEHAVLQERRGDRVEDLLWWDGDVLLGFLGLYAFGPPDVELAGMVDPAARRRGIGSALVDAALPLVTERAYRRALVVCSPAGRAFAQARGAVLDHSEHFLVLGGTPRGTDADASLTLRPATEQDAPEVERLLVSAFDWRPDNMLEMLAGPDVTLLAERDGGAVGTVRLSRHEGVGSVYGFAVDPAQQGSGIGRDVLARVCRQFRDEGLARVTLEVAVENDRALGLYTSLGFAQEATEEYWALPL